VHAVGCLSAQQFQPTESDKSFFSCSTHFRATPSPQHHSRTRNTRALHHHQINTINTRNDCMASIASEITVIDGRSSLSNTHQRESSLAAVWAVVASDAASTTTGKI